MTQTQATPVRLDMAKLLEAIQQLTTAEQLSLLQSLAQLLKDNLSDDEMMPVLSANGITVQTPSISQSTTPRIPGLGMGKDLWTDEEFEEFLEFIEESRGHK